MKGRDQILPSGNLGKRGGEGKMLVGQITNCNESGFALLLHKVAAAPAFARDELNIRRGVNEHVGQIACRSRSVGANLEKGEERGGLFLLLLLVCPPRRVDLPLSLRQDGMLPRISGAAH